VLEADPVANLVEQPRSGGVLRHGLGSTIPNIFVECEARNGHPTSAVSPSDA
jgi:hypothetical protein